jgi:hydrogenase maturation protease
MTTPLRVSIIGLGNVFLGDDAFGPLAIEVFNCEYECDANVEVRDLGTPGMDLAPYLYDQDLVIILDAVQANEAPGTLTIYCEEDFSSSRAKLRITGHDPGLWDALAHLRLAGHAPSELILIGTPPKSCAFGSGINSVILDLGTRAAAAVAGLLVTRGLICELRPVVASPNLWWLPLPPAEVAYA